MLFRSRLAGEKPRETASDVYRFEIKVPPGKTTDQVVVEEQEVSTSYAITSSGDEQIRFFLSQPVASKKVKEGLRQALALRWAVAKTTREIQELQRQLNAVTEDQKRLRANLREMPSTAKAYKRYLEKFDLQETQVESYQADIKKRQATQHNQQKEFDDFLANFTAE